MNEQHEQSENQAVYGIIGFPLSHSLSPLMHNTAFKELGVDAVYKTFPLAESELDAFFQELKKKDSPVFGLNVTVPYKEKILKYLDSLSPLAEKINAVNTITISNKRKLSGFNTDAPGFMTHLEELGFDIKDKKIAVLGAGGSCRAILAALCLVPGRPEVIQVYNRTAEKMDALVSDLGKRLNMSIVEKAYKLDDFDVAGADLFINTTPLGLKDSDVFPIPEDQFHSGMLVYDLVYNPSETRLLKAAKKRGAKTSNGLGMLYFQGTLALQHWADTEIDSKVKQKMRAALEQWQASSAGGKG